MILSSTFQIDGSLITVTNNIYVGTRCTNISIMHVNKIDFAKMRVCADIACDILIYSLSGERGSKSTETLSQRGSKIAKIRVTYLMDDPLRFRLFKFFDEDLKYQR